MGTSGVHARSKQKLCQSVAFILRRSRTAANEVFEYRAAVTKLRPRLPVCNFSPTVQFLPSAQGRREVGASAYADGPTRRGIFRQEAGCVSAQRRGKGPATAILLVDASYFESNDFASA